MMNMLLNRLGSIINSLQWKYFIGEYKPEEQEKLEKKYTKLAAADKAEARQYRILLDTISEDKVLKDELGVNAYNLFSIGQDCFINFADPSAPVMYKVLDFTAKKTLFNEDSTGATKDAIKKELDADLAHDANYVKNFSKGYIILDFPNKVDMKSLGLDSDYKDLAFTAVNYDPKNNTVIISVK